MKTTVDNTITPSKTTTTLYLGGIVYQNDTLQFISHEEGRARLALHKYTNGTTGYGFEYDYFLKDHLGNTRMVLTQEKDTAKYMATMEAAYRTTENQLFYNIPQSSYPRASVSGYPTDNTTSPNDSLAKVNGSGQKIGPSIILKVMAGDNIDIAAKSYWVANGNPATNSSLTDALNSLANGIIGLTNGSKGTLSQLNTTGSPLYNALNSFISSNETSIANKPKAYLNWILLDEQFNYVNSYPQSGAIPVSNFAAGTLGTPGYTGIPITKSGYLYIYVSNESQGWDVFFDNLTVQHRTGTITEETHYYPFGLTMAGISSQAAGKLENKIKFQKQELQHKEFSDGSGLELYQFKYRMDDPQIGRFWQIDPLADKYVYNSTYAFSENKVIRHVELEGLESVDAVIGEAKKELANGIQYIADRFSNFSYTGGVSVESENQSKGVNLTVQSNTGANMRSIIKNNSNEGAPPAFKFQVKLENTKTLSKNEINTPVGSVSTSKTQSQDGTTTSQTSAEVKTQDGLNVGATVSKNSNGDVTKGATVSTSDGNTTVKGEASHTTNTSTGTSSFEVKVKLEQKIDNTKVTFSSSIRYGNN